MKEPSFQKSFKELPSQNVQRKRYNDTHKIAVHHTEKKKKKKNSHMSLQGFVNMQWVIIYTPK